MSVATRFQIAPHQADRELDDLPPPIISSRNPPIKQQHGRAEVLAEHDLALLAGLLPAMRCRVQMIFRRHDSAMAESASGFRLRVADAVSAGNVTTSVSCNRCSTSIVGS